jgi:Ni,Fe-hydrogenase I cytochrome b subunit
MSKDKEKADWVTPVFFGSLFAVCLLAVLPIFPFSKAKRAHIFLVCWLIGWASGIFVTLKSGKIVGRSYSTSREKNPIQYWIAVGLMTLVFAFFATLIVLKWRTI